MTKSQSLLNHNNKHVAVFVFPFSSHSTPLFNLVLKLAHASPNTSFSFFGTEQSNKPLLSKPNTPHNIQFYTISDGVPEGHVFGDDVLGEKVNFFLLAGPQNLQSGVDMAEDATKNRVTCIIADAFVSTSLTLAHNLSVPWVAVWPLMSCSLSALFHIDFIREECSTNSDPNRAMDFVPGLSQMRVGDLPEPVLRHLNDDTFFYNTLTSFGRTLPQAKAVIIIFFEELDPPLFVEDMRSRLNSVLYAGFLSVSLPLPPLPPSESDETGCLSWLDKQGAKSVAYVCFGTTVTMPPHEIAAVAEALEESGFPFLWTLKDHFKGLLPNGFLERTRNRGKMVPWTPQIQVLGHGSVGVYVTHCGFYSVCEGISNGVPMICRPFFADNMMVGRMVQDILEVGVTIEGGVFTKNGLMKNLNMIMVQEEGKKMRERAQKVKRTVVDAAGPDGKAAQDFKNLVELVSS